MKNHGQSIGGDFSSTVPVAMLELPAQSIDNGQTVGAAAASVQDLKRN